MASLENFQYSIVDTDPDLRTNFLASNNCSEEELIKHAASHHFFNDGWTKGWPNRFNVYLEGNLLTTGDVFVLCGADLFGKPVFDVI
jgi:hypothetical protein